MEVIGECRLTGMTGICANSSNDSSVKVTGTGSLETKIYSLNADINVNIDGTFTTSNTFCENKDISITAGEIVASYIYASAGSVTLTSKTGNILLNDKCVSADNGSVTVNLPMGKTATFVSTYEYGKAVNSSSFVYPEEAVVTADVSSEGTSLEVYDSSKLGQYNYISVTMPGEEEYIDETGNTAVCTDCKVVVNQTELGIADSTTWYVVKGTTTISSRIKIQGDVNLILSDGARLNANYAIDIPNGNSLTIYGQTEQSGMLYVPNQSSGWRNGICLNSSGKVTLNGGILDVTGAWNGEAAIGGNARGVIGGTVTVNRGQLTATGGNSSALTTTLNVNGGTVLAQTGGSNRTITGSIFMKGGTLTAINTQNGGVAFSIIPGRSGYWKMIAGNSAEDNSVCNYEDWNATIEGGAKYISIIECDEHVYDDISKCEYCSYIGVEPPVASETRGTFFAGQRISLSTLKEGDLIYYTTDGSTPTVDSTLYTEPIELVTEDNGYENITLKAIAVNPQIGKSSVVEYSYSVYGHMVIGSEGKNAILTAARNVIGANFVYGMSGPKVFDNAGLIYYCFKSIGVRIPRYTVSMYSYIKQNSVAVETESTEYILDKGRFVINPEPGDVVVLYREDDRGFITLYHGIYEKRESGTDYVIAITTYGTTVSELSIKDFVSTAIGDSDNFSVAIYKTKNTDDKKITNVNIETGVICGQQLDDALECSTDGVDCIMIEWKDEQGNVVEETAEVTAQQYTMQMTIIPKAGYLFTNTSSITLNNGKDVVDSTVLNEDGTLTVIAKIEGFQYEITKGTNESWTLGKDDSLTITGNGDFSKFIGIKVDGNLVDSSNYEAKSGSTIITLKASYLSELLEGEHEIEILWTNGSAITNFTVSNSVTDSDSDIDDSDIDDSDNNDSNENSSNGNAGDDSSSQENGSSDSVSEGDAGSTDSGVNTDSTSNSVDNNSNANVDNNNNSSDSNINVNNTSSASDSNVNVNSTNSDGDSKTNVNSTNSDGDSNANVNNTNSDSDENANVDNNNSSNSDDIDEQEIEKQNDDGAMNSTAEEKGRNTSYVFLLFAALLVVVISVVGVLYLRRK